MAIETIDMKLVKGKQNAKLKELVERYNKRVILFGSPAFKNIVESASKTDEKTPKGIRDSMDTVKTLITTAQNEHKKFTTGLGKMRENIGSKNDKLETSKGDLGSAVIPSIKPVEQKSVNESIKTIDLFTEKLGVVLGDSATIIDAMKAKKFGFKKEALEYLGVISDKSLNNAQKYMEEDMLKIKNKLDEYLKGETKDLSEVEGMFESKDKKAWQHNYDKINKASKKEEVSSVEAEFGKAVKEAQAAGKKIRISPMPEAKNMNRNYDETRKSEMEKVAEKVKAESDRICVKYKIKRGKALIESIINYTFQNKFMENLNKSLASKNQNFLIKVNAGFVEVNKVIKKISANKIKSDGDIKKRNFSLVSILLKIIKTLLKIVLEATVIFLALMLSCCVSPLVLMDSSFIEGIWGGVGNVHESLWGKN